MIEKNKPWRSSKFLAFCHEEMRSSACCLCRERAWDQLHHFGDDGGKGMKPSDNEVARVCYRCHRENDLKRRGLIKSGKEDVLLAFERDALALNREYMRALEGKREPTCCAVEELTEWLAKESIPLASLQRQRKWLLSWADRRWAELIDAIEGVEEDGQDEDRVVR